MLVLLHLLITLVHGAAHSFLYILMASWQNTYILLVIMILPLVAGMLLWRRRRAGFTLLFLSMLGAFVFGGYYHFILPGPDNVAELTEHSWTLPFQVSAVLLALTEAAGTLVGLLGAFAKVDSV